MFLLKKLYRILVDHCFFNSSLLVITEKERFFINLCTIFLEQLIVMTRASHFSLAFEPISAQVFLQKYRTSYIFGEIVVLDNTRKVTIKNEREPDYAFAGLQ
jgi:hypothetical protein